MTDEEIESAYRTAIVEYYWEPEVMYPPPLGHIPNQIPRRVLSIEERMARILEKPSSVPPEEPK